MARWLWLLTAVSGLLSVALAERAAVADKRVSTLSEQLADFGYRTETVAQIQEALKSQNYVVRTFGYQLLAERLGRGAVESLRQGIRDENQSVRIATTRALRLLGDSSGLDVLRHDFAGLTGHTGADFSIELLRAVGEARSAEALDVALALSEFGDPRGHALARTASRSARLEAVRYRAAWVLAQLATIDPARLRPSGIDAASDLAEMAGTEQSEVVQLQVLAAIRKSGVPASGARGIYVRLMESPYASDRVRARSRAALESLQLGPAR